MATAAPVPSDTSRRLLAVGAFGERLAARHLTGLGMVVLDRNWRCDAGEIDLVLRDGDVLVVCEVKTRTSTACGTPHEAVTAAKLGRLGRLAARWVADHGVHPAEVRIDLVAVLCRHRGAPDIEHVAGLG